MSNVYKAIGRAYVAFIRVRYRRQIRIAIGVALGSILIGGYLASRRDVDEG